MLIQQGALAFPALKGTGPQHAEQVLNFASPVASSAALLSGFDVQFVEADHHLHVLELGLSTRALSDQAAEVTGALGLRDSSGRWDDPYTGVIRYVLVAPEAPEQILGGTLDFPASSGSGPQTINETVRFAQAVQNEAPVLTGFLARFTTEDHHLLQLEVDLQAQMPAQNELQVSGTFGLRDSSGNWDDKYDGQITYAALGTNRTKRGLSQVRTGRMNFGPQAGSGPREAASSISFAQPIGGCAAALTGFQVAFDENDHHFHRAIVLVEARKMSGTDVEVVGRFGLRDLSGEWDDRYKGSIRFAVLGE